MLSESIHYKYVEDRNEKKENGHSWACAEERGA